jgi:hypothetical protein
VEFRTANRTDDRDVLRHPRQLFGVCLANLAGEELAREALCGRRSLQTQTVVSGGRLVIGRFARCNEKAWASPAKTA